MDHGRTVEAARLREEMEYSRASIAETVEEIKGAVSQAIDWREQVKAHPGASLGVVAGAGLVFGHWLGGKIVGGGDRPRAPAAAAPPADPSGPGLLDGSLNRASTRVESLVNLVIDEVADAVETAAIAPLFARLRGYLRTTTAPGTLGESVPSLTAPDSSPEPRPSAGAPAWAGRPRVNGGFER
jgi:hypothetical protein